MRMIDADAIAPKLEGKFNQDYVRYAPTIDAVPVVRCKECEHCGTVPYSRVMYCKNPMGRNGCVPTKGDAFCSYGERRSE